MASTWGCRGTNFLEKWPSNLGSGQTNFQSRHGSTRSPERSSSRRGRTSRINLDYRLATLRRRSSQQKRRVLGCPDKPRCRISGDFRNDPSGHLCNTYERRCSERNSIGPSRIFRKGIRTSLPRTRKRNARTSVTSSESRRTHRRHDYGGRAVEILISPADWADLVDWIERVLTIGTLLIALGRWTHRVNQRHVVQSFFGGRTIKTYFPLRTLENRTVIAEADFLAAQHLAEFLSKYRIDVEFDYVAPDGIINLTQPGIIAICGPKSSPMIADALSHDDAIHFSQIDAGDYVLDNLKTGKRYSSMHDTAGTSADIGYLARNAITPGAKSTFISIAGVHAEGSVIIVRHLCSYRTIKTLHNKTKGKLFSSIIGGLYQCEPLKVTDTRLIALELRNRETIDVNRLAEVTELPD